MRTDDLLMMPSSPEWTTVTNREAPLTIVRQPPSAPTSAEASTPLPHGQLTWTPATFALFEAIRHRRYRQSLLLVEAGVDVNRRNDRGETPLIFTITHTEDSKTRDKFVRLLLDAGADPNAQDWRGLTALMHASLRGYTEVVGLLLEHEKTDISIQDTDGNTALMYAACFGNADVISVFLSTYRTLRRALQLGQRNNHGLTALQLASKNKHDACIRLLTREAQQFPSGMQNEFPELADLDRAPTPSEEVQPKNGKQSKKSSVEIKKPSVPGNKSVATKPKMSMVTQTNDEDVMSATPLISNAVEERGEVELSSPDRTEKGDNEKSGALDSQVQPNSERPPKPEPTEDILEVDSRYEDEGTPQALPRVRRPPAAPVSGMESKNGLSPELSGDERSISPPGNAWRGPSRLTNRLPMIPLRSLSRMQSASSKWKDHLDLDFLAGAESRRKLKSKSRLSETGSRSLSESREPCSEALQAVKEKPFGSSDRLQETLSEYWEQQLANWSSNSSASTVGVSITDAFLAESRFKFEKDLVRLPPIRSSLASHKRSLEAISASLSGKKDNNTNKDLL